jgi:hypothetical protein
MFRKFVVVTGVLEILLALGAIAGAVAKIQPAVFLPSVLIGAFLLFCAACLLWAAQDLQQRGPVIFWQGLLRLFAVILIGFSFSNGWVGNESLVPGVIDLIVGSAYVIGITRVLGISPLKILWGHVR